MKISRYSDAEEDNKIIQSLQPQVTDESTKKALEKLHNDYVTPVRQLVEWAKNDSIFTENLSKTLEILKNPTLLGMFSSNGLVSYILRREGRNFFSDKDILKATPYEIATKLTLLKNKNIKFLLPITSKLKSD